MRPLFCALLYPLCLLLQSAPAPKFFPIPENMQYEFPGVRLSEADAELLEKAFAADIAKEDDCDDERPVHDRIVTARLSLGKLGNGIIAKVNEVKKFCFCGTGGCPMFVYVREKDGYRTVAEDFGWAFGVVESKSDIPNLAFASSGGGGLMSLVLQRYDGRFFVAMPVRRSLPNLAFLKSPMTGGMKTRSSSVPVRIGYLILRDIATDCCSGATCCTSAWEPKAFASN